MILVVQLHRRTHHRPRFILQQVRVTGPSGDIQVEKPCDKSCLVHQLRLTRHLHRRTTQKMVHSRVATHLRLQLTHLPVLITGKIRKNDQFSTNFPKSLESRVFTFDATTVLACFAVLSVFAKQHDLFSKDARNTRKWNAEIIIALLGFRALKK